MLAFFSKKNCALLFLASIMYTPVTSCFSSLAQNDPYPIFTSADPHIFLSTKEKEHLKANDDSKLRDGFGLSISPFGQNADIGRDIRKDEVELGDLHGRWAMIPTLYGEVNSTEDNLAMTLPGTKLPEAFSNLFAVGADMKATGTLNNPDLIDPLKQFGFFSIPLCYRKRGMRFEFETHPVKDFGFKVKIGVADMCLTASCNFNDLTANSTFVSTDTHFTKDSVQNLLMKDIKTISEEIGLDINDFHEVGIEDIHIMGYWRHVYDIHGDDNEWAHYLLVPYVMVGGTIPAGDEKDPNKAFGLPFGNNGHASAGLDAGINFDFAQTVEIGAHAGFTHYFKKTFCKYRVPNHSCQSGIYPFQADVEIDPGNNWHFGAKLYAHHFLDKLSFHFEYILVQHEKDKICLINEADKGKGFVPEKLKELSDWKAQVANIGLNYDISPNASLGFLWQAPLNQLNVYRTTTLMFSFNAIF